ncbi:trimeric LpxA-like protein [Melampsora americana]|nr:trimeric LpxA-like protein [Melampsora americana]
MSNKYTIAGSTTLPQTDSLTEKEKMLSGQPYLAVSDVQLVKDRLRARHLLQRYNQFQWPSNEVDDPEPDYFGPDERRVLLAELFGIQLDEIKNRPIEIEPPFWCDYGTNITFKGPFYSNFNCHILDCATVTFGSRVIVGPNVQIYAGTHSTDVAERKQGLERAYPVTIGDDVWIGGGAIVLGPCTIGNGTTIAAGAVVRGHVPSNVVMGGIPARILKRLESRGSNPRDRSNPNLSHPKQLRPSRPSSRTSKRGGPTTDRDQSPTASQASEGEEEAIDPTTECFLANIPTHLRPVELKAALRAYGALRRLTLDRARHIGFARYMEPAGADAALEAGRGPDGFIVTTEDGTEVVVGIERRRSGEEQRSFNPELITNPRCYIRTTLNQHELSDVKATIEHEFGPLKHWFVRRDETGTEERTEVELEFEHLNGAREAIKASRAGEGGLGLELASGIRVRVESKRTFGGPLRVGRGGYMRGGFRGRFNRGGFGRGGFVRGGFRKRGMYSGAE